MRNLLEEIPSIPEFPPIAPLHIGITTRVMAKRQSLQRERERKNSLLLNYDATQHRRRSSKFLEGSAIPNSVIRSEMNQPDPVLKDSVIRRKERDEFVEELLKRPQSQRISLYNEDIDRAALNRIKQQLEEGSPSSWTHRHILLNKTKQRLATSEADRHKSMKDSWEELKEKRRISRRTTMLTPLQGERRSTYESIKEAIHNSKVVQQLLNADNIEEQKIKQIQTEKSIAPLTSRTSVSSTTSRDAILSQKMSKREGPKGYKERRMSKRKSSARSEKSGSISLDKPVQKKKGSVDFKKRYK